MNSKNSNGPRTVPCGTPLMTGMCLLSTKTCCVLSVRKPLIQLWPVVASSYSVMVQLPQQTFMWDAVKGLGKIQYGAVMAFISDPVLSIPPRKMEYYGVRQYMYSSDLDFCSACSVWGSKGNS